VASNKQQINWEEIKEATGKLGNRHLLSELGFVQSIAPPLLSRDRRIKMEQINNLLKGGPIGRKSIVKN